MYIIVSMLGEARLSICRTSLTAYERDYSLGIRDRLLSPARLYREEEDEEEEAGRLQWSGHRCDRWGSGLQPRTPMQCGVV